MSTKKFVISVLAVFIAYEAVNSFIHLIALREYYEELAHLWRNDMQQKMWVMYMTSVVQAIIFVYFFTVGFVGRGVREGVRFGFIFGILMCFVSIFNQYAVYPVPLGLAWQWFAYGLIQYMICGIVVALVYQTDRKTIES
jgi:hypothetical protein